MRLIIFISRVAVRRKAIKQKFNTIMSRITLSKFKNGETAYKVSANMNQVTAGRRGGEPGILSENETAKKKQKRS